MSFWRIFQGFLSDSLNSLINDFISQLDTIFGNLLDASFYVEDLPGLQNTFLNPFVLAKVFGTLYGFLTLLLVAKILWKGGKVYILWRDGDSETPPTEMLLGGILSICVAVFFPTLYAIGIDVVHAFIETIGGAMFPDSLVEISGVLDVLTKMLTMGFSFIIFGLVYGVLLLWLMFSMLKQGVEMLVFRMGIPIAAIGLVDSDGGVWKPYIQTLFRQYASAIIRYLCLQISIRMVFTQTFSGIVVGIAFIVVAVKTPAMLAQFLAPKSPGGAVQKAGLVVSAVRIFGGA